MKLKELSTELREKSGIYKLSLGGHIYIGSSKNLYARLAEHRGDLIYKKHSNDFLQRAFNKHGLDAAEFDIIEYCDPEVRFEREKFWINELKADMNLQDPVTLKPTTQYTRDKISEKSKQSYAEGRNKKKFDTCEIECYDYFGNYITSYKDKDEAAKLLGIEKHQIETAASGYKKGVTLRGKRFRYSVSKVPVQKFDINPQFLGRYFDFNYIDENGEEHFAFDSIKNVYSFFANQVKNGSEKITIIPRLRKYCEAWNAPTEGNHIPSPSEMEERIND